MQNKTNIQNRQANQQPVKSRLPSATITETKITAVTPDHKGMYPILLTRSLHGRSAPNTSTRGHRHPRAFIGRHETLPEEQLVVAAVHRVDDTAQSPPALLPQLAFLRSLHGFLLGIQRCFKMIIASVLVLVVVLVFLVPVIADDTQDRRWGLRDTAGPHGRAEDADTLVFELGEVSERKG